MKVLLIGDLKVAAQLARPLQSQEWEVVAPQSENAALHQLAHATEPHIALLLVGARTEASLELLQRMRALPSTRLIYPLCVGKLSDSFLAASYEAGCEGELRAPLAPELLLARVGGLARLIRMRNEEGLAPESVFADAAADSAEPEAALDKLLGLPAWRGARDDLAKAAGQFLGLPSSAMELSRDSVNIEMGCSIMLSNVESELQLRIGLGVDAHSANDLTVHLFGEAGDDLAGDMIGELANICMGTLKRTFGDFSVSFTGGLPEKIANDLVLRPDETFTHQQAFAISVASAKIALHLGIISTSNTMKSIRALREGMVLAKDLYNARGILLVNGGTRLSSAMVDKLFRMLPPELEVEVQSVER